MGHGAGKARRGIADWCPPLPDLARRGSIALLCGQNKPLGEGAGRHSVGSRGSGVYSWSTNGIPVLPVGIETATARPQAACSVLRT